MILAASLLQLLSGNKILSQNLKVKSKKLSAGFGFKLFTFAFVKR